jgi:uncharacterized phage protein (TIGR02216 family)
MDWPGLMRVGLYQLRLNPAVFWALTPAELQMMQGAAGAAAPMGRLQFDALLRDFPDDVKDEMDG